MTPLTAIISGVSLGLLFLIPAGIAGGILGWAWSEREKVWRSLTGRALSPSATEPLRVSSLTGNDRYRGERVS